MAQDDLVSALQQAVRQEVAENYFRERRLLEEERNMLLEDACAYHGCLAAYDQSKAQLAQALLEPELAETYFREADMALPEGWAGRHLGPPLPGRSLAGLTTCGRYLGMVRALHGDACDRAAELGLEHRKLLELLAEVNADIRHFEANHDLLTLTAYMRSLDPQELQRRKIMGVNFGHGETSAAAAQLSFKPLRAEFLQLEHGPETPQGPGQVWARRKGALRAACRRNRRAVEEMFAARRRWLESLGR